jgi:hypothetical protein
VPAYKKQPPALPTKGRLDYSALIMIGLRAATVLLGWSQIATATADRHTIPLRQRTAKASAAELALHAASKYHHGFAIAPENLDAGFWYGSVGLVPPQYPSHTATEQPTSSTSAYPKISPS